MHGDESCRDQRLERGCFEGLELLLVQTAATSLVLVLCLQAPPSKPIKFSITSNVGQATPTFEGSLRSDGSIAGTYCSMHQAGHCNYYGIWSVAPVTS